MDAMRVRGVAGVGAGLVLGVALTVTLGAQADGQSDNCRTLPYSGYVDFDGQPVNAGSVGFNFALFPCANPGTAAGQCAPLWVATGSWANGFPAAPSLHLPIFAGRFSVELGGAGQTALPDVVFTDGHEVLWLAIQIEGKTLGNLQKLTPTFRAISAGETDRLRVRSEVAIDDAAGGSALVKADDGLVIGHSSASQARLLTVGDGAAPPLVVGTDGSVVSGGLEADQVTASDVAATRVTVSDKIGGVGRRLDVDGTLMASDVGGLYRAGLVYDSNMQLDAMPTGGASYVTDVLPNGRPAMSFTGGYMWLSAAAREVIRPRANVGWSFEAWFKTRSASSAEQALLASYECSTQLLMVLMRSDKVMQFVYRTVDENIVDIKTTTPVPDPTKWHHVVTTRSASGILRIYVDGVLGATSVTANAQGQGSDYRILLGNHFACDNSPNAFNGEMDAVRIYHRELPANEISDYYQATRALYP